MIHYSNNIAEGVVVNTERDKTMNTPYTAHVTPVTPSVYEYTVSLGHKDFAPRKINAIKAVRTIVIAWADRNEYHGAHPLAGLREAKDFVESIMAAAMAATVSFDVTMPPEDENIHEALIATVLCHLRVPFILERKM
jgi:ribosomal protein L7/L12